MLEVFRKYGNWNGRVAYKPKIEIPINTRQTTETSLN